MLHTVTIQVNDMICGGCEERIGRVLRRLPGVRQVSADHRTGLVRVTFDPAQSEFVELVERIEQAGFVVSGTRQQEEES